MSTDTSPDDAGSSRPETPVSAPPKPRKGGFFRWLFSHILVAGLAVAGAAAYFHWTGMMASVEGFVCAPDMLGRYAASPDPAPAMPAESMAPAAAPAKPSAMIAPALKQTQPPANPFEAAWLDARQAYWDDGARAVGAYRSLIAKRPHIPGLYGELGNVYFQAGDTENAAGQYYLAGKRYLAQGDRARTRAIVAILEKLDPPRAASLSKGLTGG